MCMLYMHLVDLVRVNNLIKLRGVPISDFTFVLSLSDLYLLSVIHRIFSTYSIYSLVIPVTVSVLQGKTVPSFPFLCSFIPFLHSFPTLISPILLSPMSNQSSFFCPQNIFWQFLCNCVTSDHCREFYRNLLLFISMFP